MKSKYCNVGGLGSGKHPMLFIDPTEESLYLDETKDRNLYTLVEFIEFDHHWNIFATYAGRYTINIVLIRYK